MISGAGGGGQQQRRGRRKREETKREGEEGHHRHQGEGTPPTTRGDFSAIPRVDDDGGDLEGSSRLG